MRSAPITQGELQTLDEVNTALKSTRHQLDCLIGKMQGAEDWDRALSLQRAEIALANAERHMRAAFS